MMLHPIPLESLCRAVVHMDWKCDGDGALRIHEPIAIVVIDVQIIGNDRELIAGHLEYVVVINIHRSAPRTLDYPGGECRWYLGAVLAGRQIESAPDPLVNARGFLVIPSEAEEFLIIRGEQTVRDVSTSLDMTEGGDAVILNAPFGA